jgi:hypothetical protein
MKKRKNREDNSIQISNFSEFANFVQSNATHLAISQLSQNSTVLKNLPDVVEGSLTEDKLFFHFDRFMYSRESVEVDYESDDLYINKNDISRLIFLVANDIISFSLNKLVDQQKLYMCWDKKVKDFLWLEKIK